MAEGAGGKVMVCLAKSKRPGGFCIAGREWRRGRAGPWVRPVSGGENRAVKFHDFRYEDGSSPEVLDIIDVPVLGAAPRAWPHQHQPENWLLDPVYYWMKEGRVDSSKLTRLVEPAGTLWMNGHHSTAGVNDKIPAWCASALSSSLRLIYLPTITIAVFRYSGFGRSRLRVQARFLYLGEEYHLWVTDTVWEKYFLAQGEGEWLYGACYLTISLTELLQGACHKLVAAIIWENGAG